ncbi:hypothetical protein EVAR_29977_1 [Eumeta japonica]|uniref:Uncharacterized protein n=1 Tax=Eumeta variegata TaxID=151549 RepID=A0A4C1VJ98_EUMVA|nr:hypothetical protein EVAR_29977_1 [Eumeta japonica]
MWLSPIKRANDATAYEPSGGDARTGPPRCSLQYNVHEIHVKQLGMAEFRALYCTPVYRYSTAGSTPSLIKTSDGVTRNAHLKRYVYDTEKCCQEEMTMPWNAEEQTFPKRKKMVLRVQHEIDQVPRKYAF